jgi:hypothetical protein
MRVKNGVEPITSPAGIDRGGSRRKPPKAVAQRASLEASRCMPEHQKAKRRLTRNTVAYMSAFPLLAPMTGQVRRHRRTQFLSGRQQPSCLYIFAAALSADRSFQQLTVAVEAKVVSCPFIETPVACAVLEPIVCS